MTDQPDSLTARRRFFPASAGVCLRRLAPGCLLAAFVAGCQLRPASPSPEPADLAELVESQAYLSTQVANQGTLIAYLATRVGALSPSGTRPPVTPTPYLPVGGSVLLEQGRCCVKGLVGMMTEIHAAFEAHSPLGQVTEMRLAAGLTPADLDDLADVAWQPFRPEITLWAEAGTNWLGYYVCVQYRDAYGNLSPVYIDDISVEGHLPSPDPDGPVPAP